MGERTTLLATRLDCHNVSKLLETPQTLRGKNGEDHPRPDITAQTLGKAALGVIKYQNQKPIISQEKARDSVPALVKAPGKGLISARNIAGPRQRESWRAKMIDPKACQPAGKEDLPADPGQRSS